MVQRFMAIYRNGALLPVQPLALPEEAAVEVEIREPKSLRPKITDPEARKQLMQQLVEMWNSHPTYGIAGRFTRDELHERR